MRRAIKNEPEVRAAYAVLAIALLQCERRGEAITTLEDALARWPDFAEARELKQKISNGPQNP